MQAFACKTCRVTKDEGGKLYLGEPVFADELRMHREALGITQAELAERVRAQGLEYFSQTTVSRIEKGTRPPRIAEGEAIARVFSISLDQLLAGDERYLAVSRAIWAAGSIARRIEDLRELLGLVSDSIRNTREALEVIDASEPGPADSHAEQVIANSIGMLRQIASTDLRAVLDEVAGKEL